MRERPSSAKRTRSVAATGSCRELVAQGSSSRPTGWPLEPAGWRTSMETSNLNQSHASCARARCVRDRHGRGHGRPRKLRLGRPLRARCSASSRTRREPREVAGAQNHARRNWSAHICFRAQSVRTGRGRKATRTRSGRQDRDSPHHLIILVQSSTLPSAARPPARPRVQPCSVSDAPASHPACVPLRPSVHSQHQHPHPNHPPRTAQTSSSRLLRLCRSPLSLPASRSYRLAWIPRAFCKSPPTRPESLSPVLPVRR